MLKVGEVKEIYEMKGAGRSIRGIAQELDVSRNTVRRYLKSPEAMRPRPRPPAFIRPGTPSGSLVGHDLLRPNPAGSGAAVFRPGLAHRLPQGGPCGLDSSVLLP